VASNKMSETSQVRLQSHEGTHIAEAQVDIDWTTRFLVGLLNTPGPTGYTEQAIQYAHGTPAQFPLPIRINRKGALAATESHERKGGEESNSAELVEGCSVKEVS